MSVLNTYTDSLVCKTTIARDQDNTGNHFTKTETLSPTENFNRTVFLTIAHTYDIVKLSGIILSEIFSFRDSYFCEMSAVCVKRNFYRGNVKKPVLAYPYVPVLLTQIQLKKLPVFHL